MFFSKWLRRRKSDRDEKIFANKTRQQAPGSGGSQGKTCGKEAYSEEDQKEVKKKLQSLGYM